MKSHEIKTMERNARLASMITLCTEQARTVSGLSTELGVSEKVIRLYARPLVLQGKLFKATVRLSGKLVTYYATTPKMAHRAADNAGGTRSITWTTKFPPMFAPMAHLFGRAAC